MKKILVVLLVSLLVVLLVFIPKGNSAKWNGRLVDKEHDIVLEFEGTLDFAGNKNLRDSIVANVLGNDFARYGNNRVLRKYAKSSLRSFVATTDSVLTGVVLHTKMDGNIVCANEKYVCFKRTLSTSTSDDGDAWMTTCNCYVFDAQTGHIVQEEDIFSKQEMRALREMLVERIKTMALEDGMNFDYKRVRLNANFLITDSTITYIFNPYEIAEASVGVVEITIDR